MEKAVRAYFDAQGFTEVRTPVALPFPNLDPNVKPVAMWLEDFDGNRSRYWLHTSPELAMKMLLAEGAGDIYQISSVFRDGEVTLMHRPEFTMLEWYRQDTDYNDAIVDTTQVVKAVCSHVNGSHILSWAGQKFDLDGHWEQLTMLEAFRKHADVDSFDREEMSGRLAEGGTRIDRKQPVEEVFLRLFVEKVEPYLGMEAPTIIKDFPGFLGTMAMPVRENPDLLERFEVYIGGVELANGYSELTDAEELKVRMGKVKDSLTQAGVEGLNISPDFLEAVKRLPRCSGVSVGMDRLLMLCLGKEDISEVVFPFQKELGASPST